MMNLLANAVKYSDPVKASRVVRVECDAAPRRAHASACATTASASPPSKLAIIFDQFVRVHAHLDDELGAQGMGLGLSIVRECMDAMGGIGPRRVGRRRGHHLRARVAAGAGAARTCRSPHADVRALARVRWHASCSS